MSRASLRSTSRWIVLCVTLALGLTLLIRPGGVEGGQGSWSRLDLNGLRVNAIAVDPTNSNQMYAGTFGQGVFRSADGGQNWVQVNAGLGNLIVNAILIDPTNTSNLLAATGRGPAVGEPGSGTYRSTDRGGSWTQVLQAGATLALALTPQNPSIVYAVGGPPVSKSTDGGATWSRSFQPGTDINNVDGFGVSVDPADPNVILFAGNTEGGQGQLFRSLNAGATWDRILAGQAAILDLKFATDLRLGVLAFFGNLNGVFRSTDVGQTWQQVTSPTVNLAVRRVQPNPLNAGEVAAATESGVLRSTDAGVTFSPLDSTLGNQSVRTVTYNLASPQTLLAGTDDGVWAFTFTPGPTATPVPTTPTPVPPTPTPVPPTPVPSFTTWFFAEGSTQPPFQTWFLVQNLSDSTASVAFTFQRENAVNVPQVVSVGAHSRFSLFVNPILPNVGFSTKVTSDQQILVERSMFVSFDGDALAGIPGPNRSWLFAEGSTLDPFQTWVLVQNPNSVPANTTITYLLPNQAPVVQSLGPLRPNSRTSVFVNQVLPNQEFSLRVDSDQPVISERAMYRFPGNAATDVAGANVPATTWFFAQGSSLQSPLPTDTFLLVENPGQSDTTITTTLFDEAGNQTTFQIAMPGNSRRTIFLNSFMPNRSFGFRVVSTQPIVAERSQFFGVEPRGATAAVGATALANEWDFAEGSTQPPFSTVLSVLNPNNDSMGVRIDFALENGQVVTQLFGVGPNRKLSINVSDFLPNNAFSEKVTTSLPSVVERTMFLNKLGSIGATNAVGIPR